MFEIHALSARQQVTAHEVQSRVHGAFRFFGGWAALAGAALGGALGSWLGPRATIALGALWLAAAPRFRSA